MNVDQMVDDAESYSRGGSHRSSRLFPFVALFCISPVLRTPALASHYEVLHSFNYAAGDGAQPQASLINVGGTLYGTTGGGGAYGGGTVFAITSAAAEITL